MNARFSVLTLVSAFLLALPHGAHAAYAPLTLRYEHFLFELDPDDHPAWRFNEEQWTYNNEPIVPPAALRVDGDTLPPLPEGVQLRSFSSWDKGAIQATIDRQIAGVLNRDPGSVTIRTEGENVVFKGVGMLGRHVNVSEAATLVLEAIRLGVTDITLPVTEVQPEITIQDSSLQERGIVEVVAVGESDYRGSPASRQHNIATGLAKFNGHIIEQGSVFSFNEVLGPVNGSTGYKKELVIQGDKTLPDYGGGLCQVSTTAYRGVWEYGFPIEQRINHSYSVRYYFPEGTDATIYPPYKDIKFLNDSPGDLLIQTHADDGRAYFIYYGTRDAREAEIIGPYIWDKRSVPADKVEYTTDIPPGTSRKVGERVPGLRAGWLRVFRQDGNENVEQTYSLYEARPLYTQIGVTESELHPQEEVAAEEAEVSPQEEGTPTERPESWLTRWRRPR